MAEQVNGSSNLSTERNSTTESSTVTQQDNSNQDGSQEISDQSGESGELVQYPQPFVPDYARGQAVMRHILQGQRRTLGLTDHFHGAYLPDYLESSRCNMCGWLHPPHGMTCATAGSSQNNSQVLYVNPIQSPIPPYDPSSSPYAEQTQNNQSIMDPTDPAPSNESK